MKKENQNKKIIAMWADVETRERLNKYVKKLKVKSRANLMNNLIQDGLNDLDMMNSTGMLTLAVKGYDILGVVKEAISNKKFTIDKDERLIIDL